MKVLLAFEDLQVVLREDTVYVERRCGWCGGHGIDCVDELEIIPCAKCQGSGAEVLHVEKLVKTVEEAVS
jgi:DnaJ-class molecular chaperone